MGALDIDTRSDIYSLGVLLYELLTGSTPLERGKVRKAAHSEVLRWVREEEPQRPSTRLSRSDLLQSLSARRKTDPERLSRLVRGELDWIVMKALEKDRTRRYDTANSFARDIQRHLDGDAVEAGPPSKLYRVRKYARKHRAAFVTASAFGLLLVGSTVLSVGLAIWAIRAEERAQVHAQTAIAAVKKYSEVIRDTPELKNNEALSQLRKNLLAEPYAFFQTLQDRLKNESQTKPVSLRRLAEASFELGLLSSEVGNKNGALYAFEQARASWNRLTQLDPASERYGVELARSDSQIGHQLEAKGQPVAALTHFEAAHRIRERLAGPDPASRPPAEQAELALVYHSIGNQEMKLIKGGKSQDHKDKALAAFESALPIWKRLIRADPNDIHYQGDLTWALTQIGVIQHDPNRLREALAAYKVAHPLRERQVRERPSSTWALLDLVTNQFNQGSLEATLGQKADSLRTFQEACPHWEKLIQIDPGNPRYRAELAWTLVNVGNLELELDYRTEAQAIFDESQTRWERLVGDQPADLGYANGLAQARRGIALLNERAGRLDTARTQLEAGVELLEKSLAIDADHQDSISTLRKFLTDIDRLATEQGLTDQAAKARRKLAKLDRRTPEKSAP